jgi:hypothetical protein
MGAGSEWIADSGGKCFGSCEAHHVGCCPQEDRDGTAGSVGEGEDGEDEIDGLKERFAANGARSSW